LFPRRIVRREESADVGLRCSLRRIFLGMVPQMSLQARLERLRTRGMYDHTEVHSMAIVRKRSHWAS
jgi:hypothetical protein